MLTRGLIGYQAVAVDFQNERELGYQPLTKSLEQSHAIALQSRPNLAAARRSAVSARSQRALANANAKQDLTIGNLQQLRQAEGAIP